MDATATRHNRDGGATWMIYRIKERPGARALEQRGAQQAKSYIARETTGWGLSGSAGGGMGSKYVARSCLEPLPFREGAC
jgi:hypothetical protein